MRFTARVRSWVRSVFRHVRLRREMDEELRFHIDAYLEDLVRAGVPPAEARRRAQIEFGSVDARKEECREALGLRVVDEVSGDLRYAWRQLRRSPGFTSVAVISLALGIGANTAIFSLMEAALWRSIPVHRPDQLRLFSWVSNFNHGGNGNGRINRTASGGYASAPFSYPVFQELQRQNDLFETIFGVKPLPWRVTAVVDGQAELLETVLVTANFYKGVGVQPALGRAIGVADASEASEAAAVISDSFWARRFGRDPSVIGKRISVDATPVTIVGVNPPEFTGIQPGASPDMFLPMRLQPIVSPWYEHGSVLADADFWWVLVFGRLKPGVGTAQAEAALDVVLRRAVQTLLPDRANVDPPRLKLLSGARGFDRLTENFSKPLLVLFSLVGVVLLIACANVANLLLARAATRQREISLRRALGAGRWRVARQLLTEGLALACLGGAAGILLGYWLRDSIPSLLATSWRPAPFQSAFNWRVVGFAVAATTATGILFSLAPAWQSARPEINAALKERGRLGLPRWSRGKPLAMCQAALSILLLIGAGLFARSLWNLASVRLGFQPDRLLLFELDPPRTRYPDAQRHAVLDQLHQRIAAVPGVERATLSSRRVLGGERGRLSVSSDIDRPQDQQQSAWFNDVGYDFFETMGMPILSGRSFNRRLDHQTSEHVAVVNQQFVREFFPGEQPVGELFWNGNRVLRIVGITGDARDRDLRTPFPPTFYRLYLQESPSQHRAMTFAVRTATDEASVMTAIRETVREIDSELPVFDVRTQTEQIAATASQDWLVVTLSTAFALLAVVLAAVGIYGIMANNVARRTNEIGIRIALGAGRERVLWMVLREAALVAAIGIAVGVAAAMMLTRYIQSMLFGVEPIDPPTIVFAVVLMLIVALLAGWLPARRASRLEPMVALRHE